MAERHLSSWSTSIDRPPDEVFAYLADVARHPEWSPKPFRVEGVRPGLVQVGDTFSTVGWMPWDKDHRNEVTVTECTPARRLVLDAREGSQHFYNIFEVEPSGTGSRVTRTMDAPQPSFPLSVVFPLIHAAFISPDVKQGLRRLKERLEAG
jgi:uncharacterized protein YndB with AHSA1/START domain